MITLLLSLIILVVVPLVWDRLVVSPAWAVFNNILVLVATALVVLHILPECIHETGWSAVYWAFAGFLWLLVTETLGPLWQRRLHHVSLGLIATGLAVHGIIDGAAIALKGSLAALSIVVVLHRVLDAVFLWSFFRSAGGKHWAVGIMILLGAATVLGYVMGGAQFVQTEGLYSLQALVAGSILHLAIDAFHEHAGC